MFNFINKPSTQEKINQIASITIFAFILSIPLSTAGISISFAILLALYLFGGNYSEKINQLKSNKAIIFFLLFFTWTVLAVTYTNAEAQYIELDLVRYRKILLIPILIYFLNGKDLNSYIYTFLTGVVLLILYTMFFDQHGLITSLKTHQFSYNSNPIRNYITEGQFLAVSLFASIWFLKEKKHIVWMQLTLLIVLIHISFNNGRMALISVAFTLLLWINFSIKKIKTKVILVLILIALAIGAYLSAPLIQTRVDRTIAEASQIVNFSNAESIRLQYWHMSWEKFITRPIIGFGPGSFKQMITNSGITGEFQIHKHAHNEYLFIALQYGLIGLSLFLLGIFYTIRKFSLTTTSPARVIAFAGILIMLLNCITDSDLYAVTEGNFFILLIAIYLSKDSSSPPIHSKRS